MFKARHGWLGNSKRKGALICFAGWIETGERVRKWATGRLRRFYMHRRTAIRGPMVARRTVLQFSLGRMEKGLHSEGECPAGGSAHSDQAPSRSNHRPQPINSIRNSKFEIRNSASRARHSGEAPSQSAFQPQPSARPARRWTRSARRREGCRPGGRCRRGPGGRLAPQ
jgi:hypothetical protein